MDSVVDTLLERELRLLLVVARVLVVVVRFVLVVLRLVLVFPRLFERMLIFVSSVVRRLKIVLKISEKASCMLSKRGAELNSIVDRSPSMISIDCFQSSTHWVLVVWMIFVVLSTVVCVEPVRTVVSGSFFVKFTRVPIQESSIIGLVRT